MKNGKEKQLKEKLDDLGIEEVIKTNVKPFGTSAHVVVGKKHEGKEVTIIIMRKELKEA